MSVPCGKLVCFIYMLFFLLIVLLVFSPYNLFTFSHIYSVILSFFSFFSVTLFSVKKSVKYINAILFEEDPISLSLSHPLFLALLPSLTQICRHKELESSWPARTLSGRCILIWHFMKMWQLRLNTFSFSHKAVWMNFTWFVSLAVTRGC